MEISIKTYKRKHKTFTNFHDKEWETTNVGYYGKSVDWKKDKRYLVAYDSKNKIVGVLYLHVQANVAYFNTAIVDRGKRSEGIGTKLIKEAEKLVQRLGAHKVYFTTGKTWRKRGLSKTGWGYNEIYVRVNEDVQVHTVITTAY